MKYALFRRSLMAGAALSAVAAASSVHAQDALEEVVVTATRQADTVNRVPLSVTAVSQNTLDQQRVNSINDLARAVPSIVFRQTGYDQSSSVAIRGVFTTAGSPTTGVYLDETPISKRGFTSGGAGGANDAPMPALFDLQRIEVLRGPQGTLFGASAQGGVVRFIMPDPSLVSHSGLVRAGASILEDGDPGFEIAGAFGGPIVQDKLGFRLTASGSRQGGYLDHVSPYSGKVFGENTNWRDSKAVRLAVAWRPTERLKITPSIYYGEDYRNDVDSFIENVEGFQLNSGWFINRGVGATGVPFNFPTTYFPGGQFGPFNMYGPFKTPIGYYDPVTYEPTLQHSPAKKTFLLPALKLEYQFDGFSVTSISSLVEDLNKTETWGQNSGTFNYALPLGTLNSAAGGCFSSSPVTCVPVVGGPSGVGRPALNPFYPGFPGLYYHYYQHNYRDQFTQEIRFASDADARPLQWVGGAYYMNSRTVLKNVTAYNEAVMATYYRGFNVMPSIAGITDLHPTGQGRCYEIIIRACYLLPTQPYPGEGIYSMGYARFYEEELAGFGELNYWLTDKLKLTAGVRVSTYTTDYANFSVGSSSGANARAAGFVGSPAHPYPVLPSDPSNASVNTAKVTEKPVNPKFTVTYQADDRNMFYATAAKGYRGGGANNVGAQRPDCVTQLAAFGLSAPPSTYTSDSVWSYEGGAKMRLFGGRAQVNTSLFYIDWKEPQLSVRMPCGTSFITNAGHAVSKGIDIEARVRVTDALTASVTGGYINAQYVEDTVARDPATGALSYTVHKGDTLPTPDLQITVALDYATPFWNDWRATWHVDLQYTSAYKATVGPGGVGYNPLLYNADSTHFATASAAFARGNTEVALYVKNLTASEDRLSRLKGAGVPVMTYTFRPREAGFTVTRRF